MRFHCNVSHLFLLHSQLASHKNITGFDLENKAHITRNKWTMKTLTKKKEKWKKSVIPHKGEKQIWYGRLNKFSKPNQINTCINLQNVLYFPWTCCNDCYYHYRYRHHRFTFVVYEKRTISTTVAFFLLFFLSFFSFLSW